MNTLKLFFISTMMLSVSFSYSQEMSGLPQNASERVQKFAVQFDFDGDSCYPAPAISPDGKRNSGLKATGTKTGDCRSIDQFKNSNTYVRSRSITKEGHTYQVIMYALYFEKDQIVAWTPTETKWSHRHDWEYASVWLKDGKLTHATYSAHGSEGETKTIGSLSKNGVVNNHVKVVYHQHNVRTHAMRFAHDNEEAENGLGRWVTPAIVEWDRITSSQRELLADDWGSAHPPFIDANFLNEINKYKPSEYPDAIGSKERNTLSQGELLRTYRRLYSENGKYYLEMEKNGNLCLRTKDRVKMKCMIEDSEKLKEGTIAEMQDDGNLNVSVNGDWIWSVFNKKSQLTEGSYLFVSNDGNIKLMAPDGTKKWQNP